MTAFLHQHRFLAITPEQLRSAGLSKPKAKYVRGVAERAVDGGLPSLDDCDEMTDAEIVEKLTELNGVGRWTVEMFLIFNLARPDVLPVHDLGVRRGFQIAYGRGRCQSRSSWRSSGSAGSRIEPWQLDICGGLWMGSERLVFGR